MSDLIDRTALINKLYDVYHGAISDSEMKIYEIISMLEEQPTVYNTDKAMGRKRKWIKIEPILAWYDFWIGIFIDRKKQCLYLFPLPMIGLKITLLKGGKLMRQIDADKLIEFVNEHSYVIRHGLNNVEPGMTLTGIKQCIDEQPTTYTIGATTEKEQLGEDLKKVGKIFTK